MGCFRTRAFDDIHRLTEENENMGKGLVNWRWYWYYIL